ncbi:MAG: peptide-methionine (R)-S-oxide reductase MsrB [Rhodoferax sp.]
MPSLARRLFVTAGVSAAVFALVGPRGSGIFGAQAATTERFSVAHTDEEWRKLLSPNQYAVLREEGTERAFTSPLNEEHRTGHFLCAGCNLDLFSSKTKFNSGTGWPSFWQPLDKAVVERKDSTWGMARTEVHCQRCGGHLGHVFDDGPAPTGLRYCMNGVSLRFTPSAA